MGRVIHVRLAALDPARRDDLHSRFDELVGRREWRDRQPWLADSRSHGLFEQLFFDAAARSPGEGWPQWGEVSAATFVRLQGDETDALALLFVMRDLSESFATKVAMRDPDNPIAKLRAIDLVDGRLAGDRPVEDILVRRPVFKKLLDGSRIELFPPRVLRPAFGRGGDHDSERRDWGFLVHGMRDSRPSFLEAEAEAMRMYRGLRFLD